VADGGARRVTAAQPIIALSKADLEKKKHIAGKSLSDEQLLDLLAKVPNLLRKPLLVDGKRALQGNDDPARLKARGVPPNQPMYGTIGVSFHGCSFADKDIASAKMAARSPGESRGQRAKKRVRSGSPLDSLWTVSLTRSAFSRR
jgi:hypothetical protein